MDVLVFQCQLVVAQTAFYDWSLPQGESWNSLKVHKSNRKVSNKLFQKKRSNASFGKLIRLLRLRIGIFVMRLINPYVQNLNLVRGVIPLRWLSDLFCFLIYHTNPVHNSKVLIDYFQIVNTFNWNFITGNKFKCRLRIIFNTHFEWRHTMILSNSTAVLKLSCRKELIQSI